MRLRVNATGLATVLTAFACCLIMNSCGGGPPAASPPPPITVSLSPRNTTLSVSASQQFTATVAGTSNTGVNWSVNGIDGGSLSVGMITSTGLYTAPVVPPSPNAVTVKATTKADPARWDSAAVTIVNPVPEIISISPSSLDAGSSDVALIVLGSGFTPQSTVTVAGITLTTSFASSAQLTAVVPAAQLTAAGTLPVRVATPVPGGGESNATGLTILITVTVIPPAETATVNQTCQFVATVVGSPNQTVSWSVNDILGGNASLGTIDAAGVYTPPLIPPSPNVVSVKAASTVDATRTASALVTIINPLPVISAISPSMVEAGHSDLAVTVTGTGFAQQSTVAQGTISLATTFASSTQLTALVPASQLANAGTLPVTVTNPNPGGGTSNIIELAVVTRITVSPATQTLQVTQAQQFTATITGNANQAVTWFVNDQVGGNPSVGTISSGGFYTAPSVPPVPNAVTIKAASVADLTRVATATVTVVNPVPALGSFFPANFTAGSGDSTLTVNGTDFARQSLVMLGTSALATTFVNSSQLTAVIPAAQLTTAGSQSVTVVTPGPGGGTSNAAPLTVLLMVAVSPSSPTLTTGQAQTFTATVAGSSDQTVSWSVNDIAGGNTIVGTITPAGQYTTPAIPPSPNVATVKAASIVDPTRTATATVTIVNPSPTLNSISPTTVGAGSGNTVLTATGTNFTPQSTVTLGGTPLATTLESSTVLTAILPAAQLESAGSFPIKVMTPTPGGGTSNAVDLVVLVVIAVSPTTLNLNVAQNLQFTATVTGSTNQTVIWSVNDVAGGNATVGSISTTGLYTAPTVPPSANTVTVKAASVADPTRTGTASVSVVNPVPAITSITPSTVIAGSGDTSLTVNGTGFAQQSTVQLDGSAITTIFSGSPTQLSAVMPAALLTSSGISHVTVVNPGPGGGTSNGVNLRIVSPVTVTPRTPTLSLNETRQFTATVSGEADQSVTWFVNDLAGGNSTVGTISTTGLYIAPGVVPAPETVTIKAVSVANPNKSGTALATVTLPTSDNYPRPGAGSILHTPPPLVQVPQIGSKVAILDWTSKDPDGTDEDVLSLCNSLSPLGIPHVHTSSWATASGYPFIAVAGDFGSSLTTSERNALVGYVQSGGILFLWNVTDSALLTSLGIGASNVHSGTTVRPLTFDVLTADPALHYIDDGTEINLQMAYPSYGDSYGYDSGSTLALGYWDNGEAAVLRSSLGTGGAYVFGWRLRHVVTDAELLRVPGVEPPWTNVSVLDADIQKMLLRGVYEDKAGVNAQLRQFAPGGHHAALILTHDIDDILSYERTPVFAQLEHDLGVTATFNLTTSPYDTGWVETFYDATGRQEIQQALDLGQDIESHSVGHFPDFDQASFGSGMETAANYFPQYSSDLNQTLGMSVLGELGVSRWLLENDFGITVEGFRSGYLSVPNQFLEGLKQTGYRRDSTYAAGVTRGSFPFVAFEAVNGTVTTYPIVEYPLAISDDHDPPNDFKPDTYSQYLDAWEAVIRANYANNAPTVLLIHPIDDTIRVQALQDILPRVSDLDLWVGDWKFFAEFWEAQGVTCQRYP